MGLLYFRMNGILSDWSVKAMTENEMLFFLNGYIYAQAEQIVKEFRPVLSDDEFREEVVRVQKMLIHNLIRKERGEDGKK
jgi:hypothetical protein